MARIGILLILLTGIVSCSLNSTTNKALTSNTTKKVSILTTTTTKKASNVTTRKALSLTTTKKASNAGTTKKASSLTTKKALSLTTTKKASSLTTKNASNITTKKPLTKSTTPKTPNIRSANDIINKIYANLNNKESRIARMMQREVIALKSTQKSVESKPKFHAAVSDALKLFTNSMANANFPIFQISSGQETAICNSVVVKISTMERDIQRFGFVQSCASVNASYLEDQIRILETLSKKLSINFTMHLESGEEIVKEIGSYTQMLDEGIKLQSQMVNEMTLYRNRNCLFESAKVSSSSRKKVSTSSSKNNAHCCFNGGSGKFCCLNGADNSECKLPTPCGTLVDLSRNDPLDSHTLGFKSGTYIDKSAVYPGVGKFYDCNGKNPARISVAKEVHAAYGACDSLELYQDNSTAQYYLSHPQLKWVPATLENVSSIRRTLKVLGSNDAIKLVARFNFTHNTKSVSTIGYFSTENREVFYWDGETSQTSDNFEILTCSDCTNGGSGFYCCLNGANNPSCCLNGGSGQYCCKNGANNPDCIYPLQCGSLLELSSNDPFNPFTLGLNSGTYLDGSLVFPGIAFFSDCNGMTPARVSAFKNRTFTGAYTTCESKTHLNENMGVKYLYAHPKLQWIPVTPPIDLLRLPNIIRIYDFSNRPKIIGRYNFTVNDQNFTQIGFYLIDGEYSFYWNGTNSVKAVKDPFEVLTCTSCPDGGFGSFCCPNGAENPDCCLKGKGKWCCENGADNAACVLPQPCGSSLEIAFNDPYNPLTPGLPSGYYFDGSIVFPGSGYFKDQDGNNPARISITSNYSGAGAYSLGASSNSLLYNRTGAKYFIAHPDLKWVPASLKNLSDIQRKLTVNTIVDDGRVLMRINFTVGNQVITEIAVFTFHAKDTYFWNGTYDALISNDQVLEVLTCDKCKNGGFGFYCCLNGADNIDCCPNGGIGRYCCTNGANNPDCELTLRCGTLLDFESNDPSSLFTPGFKSGTYIDGSTLYPGVGFFSACGGTNPARISISKSEFGPGAYSVCNGLNVLHDNIGAKYFYNHPKMKWVSSTPMGAFNVPGSIQIYDSQEYSAYVVRVNFTVGNQTFSQIGQHYSKHANYWNGKIVEKAMDKIDVLACAD